MSRKSTIQRDTNETKISVSIDLDGSGNFEVNTGIGFFDHMLEQLSKHSLINMTVKCDGDIHIDFHHSVEDVAIALGQAFKEAIGDKNGIERYGSFLLPMDDTLTEVAVDFSGRPYYKSNLKEKAQGEFAPFNFELVDEFLYALSYSAMMNIHVNVKYGSNGHHIIESIFKALARAIRNAVEKNSRITLNSTKGLL